MDCQPFGRCYLLIGQLVSCTAESVEELWEKMLRVLFNERCFRPVFSVRLWYTYNAILLTKKVRESCANTASSPCTDTSMSISSLLVGRWYFLYYSVTCYLQRIPLWAEI